MAGAGGPPVGHDSGPPDLRAVGDRIDALLDASSSGGAVARQRAEELVRLVADLYGAGLERVLEIVHEGGGLGDEVLDALADDDLVASLLIVHGLHPYGVEQRVEQALERVRPYLGSHGGDVELVQVTQEGTVRLRLLGTCDGCPSSSVTLKLAVEGAIGAAAPEVAAIEVEAGAADPGSPVIPVDALMSHVREAESTGSWEAVPALAALAPGAVTSAVVEETVLVACRVGEDLLAFRDGCPRCGTSLARGTLARRLGGDRHDALLVCPACQAHFDVRRAGSCLDDPTLHLDPLPLLRDGASVSVAVPRPVPS
jgi:Fe-S cluster biogenesis protein NfuA/nitrite reductase/ring-hydroxylating ferredoxin subunit